MLSEDFPGLGVSLSKGGLADNLRELSDKATSCTINPFKTPFAWHCHLLIILFVRQCLPLQSPAFMLGLQGEILNRTGTLSNLVGLFGLLLSFFRGLVWQTL